MDIPDDLDRLVIQILLEECRDLELGPREAARLGDAITEFVRRSLEKKYESKGRPPDIPETVCRIGRNYLQGSSWYLRFTQTDVAWLEKSNQMAGLASRRWNLDESAAQDIADIAVQNARNGLHTFLFEGTVDAWLGRILYHAFLERKEDYSRFDPLGDPGDEPEYIGAVPIAPEGDNPEFTLFEEADEQELARRHRLYDLAIANVLTNRDMLRGFVLGARAAGIPGVDLGRNLGIPSNTIYTWWRRFVRNCEKQLEKLSDSEPVVLE